MLDQVIELFRNSGQVKLVFTPAIKIQLPGNRQIVWIDSMQKVKDTYMIAVSNTTDNFRMNLAFVEEIYIKGLFFRLNRIYGKKILA